MSPLRFLLASRLTFSLATAQDSRPHKVLRVTAIPDVNKDTLREDQARISSWLEAKTGVPVRFEPVTNYSAAVAALVSGQVDMAWLGGVTAVQAIQQSKNTVRPLVTRANDLKFKSYVIVGAGVKAEKLQDLKGKSFTFGAKASTSGHVMPRYLMGKEGIRPEQDFSKVAYSGDHSKTVLDVAGGVFDAGVVNYTYFDRMIAEKKVDPAKVRVLWTTPEYVDYCWVVRNDVDTRCGASTTQKIADAFTALDAKVEADQAILKVQSTDKYVAAKAEWWDGIKKVLESIDLSGK